MTQGPDLSTTVATEFARRLAKEREEKTKQALRETDWEATPIVDIVWAHPQPEPQPFDTFEGSIPKPEFCVERYEHPPPRMKESRIQGRRCEIQRVTRPLYERLQQDERLDL